MSSKFNTVNLDDNETVFFARELENVKAKAYDIVYPEFAATSLIPVSTDAGPAAETITYQQYDQLGVAKIIANYADDLPRADVKGKEFSAIVKSVGSSYGYNIQEIRASQRDNKNLEQRKANAARRAIEQKLNNVAWFGDAANNLNGLVTHPNVTRVSVDADGTGSATTFASKTPDQILRDMNDLVVGIVTLTKGMERPNTLIMPHAQLAHIQTTARSANSDTTILEFFLRNNPYIQEVQAVNELAGAGQGVSGGVAAGTDVMIAYDRNPDKLTLEVPQMFEQFAAQEKGLDYVVPCHARVAGIIVYYPLSIAIAEGI